MALTGIRPVRRWTRLLHAAVFAFLFSSGAIGATEIVSAAVAAAGGSRTVQLLAASAVRTGDNADMSFVVVDKPGARMFVFDPRGKLLGSSAVLLGSARGDESVPGIGDRPLSTIKASERTTAAGRFVGERGRNLDGEDNVWIDYDAALSIHRVRPGPARERRMQRLASPTPADNRISYGCVNTPVKFFEQVVAPVFARGHGIIYILPDTRPAEEVFAFLTPAFRTASVP